MAERHERDFLLFRDRGDGDALARVFDALAPKLLLLAAHVVRDEAQAEDVLQETFLRVMREADRYDASRPLFPWLVGILQNEARVARRSDRRSPDPDRVRRQKTSGPLQEVEERDFLEQLSEQISKLPQPYRDVLNLRLAHGLSGVEIAHALTRPLATVHTQLRRGTEMLRRALPAGMATVLAESVSARGLAAVRQVVLAGSKTAVPSTLWTVVGGVLLMKKTVFLIAGLLITLTVLGFGLLPEDAPVPVTPDPVLAFAANDVIDPGLVTVSVPGSDEETGSFAQFADREPVNAELSETAGSSLLVRVVRRDTGDPVPGFWITLGSEEAMTVAYGIPKPEGFTDERGEILWEGLDRERVALAPAMTLDWFDLQPGQNQRIHEVDVSFTIEGQVLDLRGQPVSGAEIWTFLSNAFYSALAKAAVTDSAGRFSLPILESDRLFVFAQDSDSGPSRVAWVSRPENGGSVELRLTIGNEVGVIVGEIVSPDGVPIPEATVQVHHSVMGLPIQEDPTMRMRGQEVEPLSLPQRTDAQGRFRFGAVTAGEATLNAIANGWAGTSTKVEVLPGTTSRVRITLGRGARVAGTVRDASGQPVPDVVMIARQHYFSLRTAVTDEQGRYALENVPAGYVILEAAHPNRGRANHMIELAHGDEYTWEPEFSAGADLRAVVFDYTGAPLTQTRISLTGEDRILRWFQTDSEGRFTAQQCKDQVYEIKAYPPTFSGGISMATGVRPGGEVVELSLPELPAADAFVTGRVVGPLGPVSPVQVSAREDEQGSFVSHRAIAPDGSFRMGPMISGTWTFGFDAAGHPLLEQAVTLVAGETDLGAIELEEAVPVEVLVREPAGLEDSVVGRLWGPGFHDQHVRIESGRAVLPPLRAGAYTLQVHGRLIAIEARDFELVAGQQTRVLIDLQPGVRRSLQVSLPEGIDGSVLTFATFDASGRELASWRMSWYASWEGESNPVPFPFRPEAVRLVVAGEDGLSGEARLGPDVVRVELR